MDKPTLDQILTNALKTQPFTVSGDLLQSADITTLFTAFLTGGNLTLGGASQITSGNSDETVIAGTLQGTFLGQTSLHAEAHFTVVNQQAEVVIYLTNLPSGWKPSTSFPVLAGSLADFFSYSAPTFTLDSQLRNTLPANYQTAYGLPANSAGLEATVKKGLSLAATVTIDTGIAFLTELMSDPSFTISMPVEFAGNVPRMVLTMQAAKPYSIAGFTFPLSLDYVVSLLEPPNSAPLVSTSLTQLSATIEKQISGKNVQIPIAVQFDGTHPSQLVFISDMESSAISVGEISGMIAGGSIAGQIPDDFPALSDIGLLKLEVVVAIVGSSPRLLGVSATVGYTDPNAAWSPFGSLVRFHGMSVTFSYSPGSGVATHVAAKADIAGGTLDAEVQLPEKTFGVALEPSSKLDVAGILNDIVGNSVSMPQILCTQFSVLGDVTAGSYQFNALVETTWSFSLGSKTKPFVLDSIGFDVTHTTGAGGGTTGEMIGKFTVAGAELQVKADYKGGTTGWIFEGGTPVGGSINLTALIADAASMFGLTLPTQVPAITIINIDMMFETGTSNFFFSCGSTFTMLEKDVEIGVLASNVDDAGNRATVFHGYITIGTAQFEIDFTSGQADKRITAEWADAENPLDFAHVASFLHLDISDIPSELIPQVTSASFTYDFTSKTLVLTATTEHTKTVVISTLASDGVTRIYGALLGVQVSASLSDLPVVGKKLAEVEDMGIDGLQIIVTSAPLTADQVKTLNGYIPTTPAGLPVFPAQGLDKGLMLSIPFQLGGKKQPPLAIQYGGTKKFFAAVTGGSSVPGVAWLNVQRSFGPVNVNRVGVGYQDGKVILAIDAGFTFSAVAVELQGLTLGFTLEMPPKISPALHGMSLSYSGGPIQISGGFLEVINKDGSVEYDGGALIKAENFTLSAIGSYATVDGAASLFIFAMLAAPLGGPAFFFVTGVAAGFGVNRSLIIPTLDALPKFPLVAAAMAGETGNNPFGGTGGDPTAALQVMHQYIPPSYGENWLALGVRFTSFEMIQSFALVTVSFGTSFEVALLGLSAITIPTQTESPIGFAQLALEVTYSPAKGVLEVMGKLTPGSYIFSQACHLTGGFAFFTWLTDDNVDGAPAGEFVVTLGGYHPRFTPPKYYPQVPRIGANWQVSSNLMVKGGLYFALTPTCVMAGGSLEAVWQSGNLKAWFNAEADFLLSWKPFHYSVGIGLSLGASYKLDLLFTSKTITVHVGVWLNLWGPPFAGTAEVDLSVITFTIHFGHSNPSIQPIGWDDFKKSFLPKPQTDTRLLRSQPRQVALVGDTAPTPTDTYCYVRVGDGLIKDLTSNGADDPDWVINPEKFQLVTHSAVPCTRVTLVTGNGDPKNPGTKSIEVTGSWDADGFGVGPVGVANGNLVSHHIITVLKVDADGNPENAYDFSQHAELSALVGNAPKSAWSAGAALNPDFSAINNNPSIIPGMLSGFAIEPYSSGVDHTVPISIATLQATRAQREPRFSWTTPNIPTSDTFNQSTAIATLMSTINAGAAAGVRSGILGALAAHDVAVAQTVDVSRMAASAVNVLVAAPVLSLLGEEPL